LIWHKIDTTDFSLEECSR